jgi:hypothetical protein
MMKNNDTETIETALNYTMADRVQELLAEIAQLRAELTELRAAYNELLLQGSKETDYWKNMQRKTALRADTLRKRIAKQNRLHAELQETFDKYVKTKNPMLWRINGE